MVEVLWTIKLKMSQQFVMLLFDKGNTTEMYDMKMARTLLALINHYLVYNYQSRSLLFKRDEQAQGKKQKYVR